MHAHMWVCASRRHCRYSPIQLQPHTDSSLTQTPASHRLQPHTDSSLTQTPVSHRLQSHTDTSLTQTPRAAFTLLIVSMSGECTRPYSNSTFNVVLCLQILDLSMNPLGVNGGRLVAELLDPAITPHQFLVELRMDKVRTTCLCMRTCVCAHLHGQGVHHVPVHACLCVRTPACLRAVLLAEVRMDEVRRSAQRVLTSLRVWTRMCIVHCPCAHTLALMSVCLPTTLRQFVHRLCMHAHTYACVACLAAQGRIWTDASQNNLSAPKILAWCQV